MREYKSVTNCYYELQGQLDDTNAKYIGPQIAKWIVETLNYYAEFDVPVECDVQIAITETLKKHKLDGLRKTLTYYNELERKNNATFVMYKMEEDFDITIYDIIRKTINQLIKIYQLPLKRETVENIKRMVMLFRMVESNGYEDRGFSVDVLERIAQKAEKERRVLEGALFKVIAVQNREGRKRVSVEFVKKCFEKQE